MSQLSQHHGKTDSLVGQLHIVWHVSVPIFLNRLSSPLWFHKFISNFYIVDFLNRKEKYMILLLPLVLTIKTWFYSHSSHILCNIKRIPYLMNNTIWYVQRWYQLPYHINYKIKSINSKIKLKLVFWEINL